jgi:hypothetical protein
MTPYIPLAGYVPTANWGNTHPLRRLYYISIPHLLVGHSTHDHKYYLSLLYSIKVIGYLSLVTVMRNLGTSMVSVEICWISYKMINMHTDGR